MSIKVIYADAAIGTSQCCVSVCVSSLYICNVICTNILNLWIKLLTNEFCSYTVTVLPGDEEYPLSAWLVVQYSVDDNENTSQVRFNNYRRRVRMIIEGLNGVLKAIFRLLLLHKAINFNPVRSAEIILLHNIAQCVMLKYNTKFFGN